MIWPVASRQADTFRGILAHVKNAKKTRVECHPRVEAEKLPRSDSRPERPLSTKRWKPCCCTLIGRKSSPRSFLVQTESKGKMSLSPRSGRWPAVCPAVPAVLLASPGTDSLPGDSLTWPPVCFLVKINNEEEKGRKNAIWASYRSDQ